jgi:hypothetical protein
VDLEEYKALVGRYYQEVLTGRDRDLLARLLDPSFVSHVSGGPDAGDHAGDFDGVPATGRLITVSGIYIRRVRPGRLIEHWEELNLLGVLS